MYICLASSCTDTIFIHHIYFHVNRRSNECCYHVKMFVLNRCAHLCVFVCLVSLVNLLLLFPLRCDTKLSFCIFSLLWNIFFLQLIFFSFSAGFSFERWIRLQIVLLFTIVYVCVILSVLFFFSPFFSGLLWNVTFYEARMSPVSTWWLYFYSDVSHSFFYVCIKQTLQEWIKTSQISFVIIKCNMLITTMLFPSQ